jgi:DNA polymerase-3 subunit gamma/tau
MDDIQSDQPYRVLARKYRPRTFAELIGQDAMVRTLTNAIAADRLPHAFILTGVRGVGKTSTARIIARALNCTGADGQGGPTADPCGVCENCRAITEDRHIDVIEMDAASRTGVDDIRELIDGVRYRPVNARYKIYIIDEVHMLSKNAFNALLKTLEEPPEHVKFLFATTETRKVPVTVLSRCQRFDLRRVDIAVLSAHFSKIAKQEGVEISDGAIGLIARAADGSVRDGLSLLDQAIAHSAGGGAEAGGGQGAVDEDAVRDMLGLADGGRLYDLFEAVMGGKATDALDVFAEMHNSGADPAQILEDLLQLTHWLTRLKLSPAAGKAVGVSQMDAERGGALAGKLNMPVLGRTWQLLVKGLSEVRMAPSASQAAEMVLIRLAYMADLPLPADIIRRLSDSGAQTPKDTPPPAAPPTLSPPPSPTLSPTPSTSPNGDGARGLAVGAVAQLAAQAPSPRPEEPPLPDTAPEAAPKSSAPSLPQPQNFDEIIALFGEKREALLSAHLVNRVHLVRFQPGHIELRAHDDAPGDLANNVSRFLSEWTGKKWLVSLSDEAGAETLGDQRRAAAEIRRGEAISHPLVQEALAVFPGATVEAIVEREEPLVSDLPVDPDKVDEESENER